MATLKASLCLEIYGTGLLRRKIILTCLLVVLCGKWTGTAPRYWVLSVTELLTNQGKELVGDSLQLCD